MSFLCDICNKTFNSSKSVTCHKLNAKCHLTKDNLTCPKCSKIFNNTSSYDRHMKKKVTCVSAQDLECHICHKIFTNNYLLQKHLNKKISCKEVFKKKELLDQKLQEEKNLILLKHKLDLERMFTDTQNKLSIIEAQKKRDIEIETIKLNRKEKTTQIINQQNIENKNSIHIDAINKYVVNLPSTGVVSATLENCDSILKIVLLDLLESGELEKLYYKDISTVPIEIITKTYANNHYPYHKNIWYNKDLNAFYCVIDEQWNLMDKEILISILRRTFEKYMKMFYKFITYDNKQKIEDFRLMESHLTKFPLHKKNDNDIECIAKKALTY